RALMSSIKQKSKFSLWAWISVSLFISLSLGNVISAQVTQASFRAGRIDYSVRSNPLGVAKGDFNRDGKWDLAVANSNSNSVSLLLSSDRGFTPRTLPTEQDTFQFNKPQFIAVGDFDRDGKLDLAVANWNPDGDGCNVSILRGDGAGGFTP